MSNTDVLVDGVPIEVRNEDGSIAFGLLRADGVFEPFGRPPELLGRRAQVVALADDVSAADVGRAQARGVLVALVYGQPVVAGEGAES